MQDSEDTMPVSVMVLNMYWYFLHRVMLFTSLEMKMLLQLMCPNTWPRSLQVRFHTPLRDHCKGLMSVT